MRTTVRAASSAAALLVAVLTCALGALLLTAPAATSTPSEGSRSADTSVAADDEELLQTVGIGPANADGVVDRRGVFTYAGRPGTVIEDQVALVNYTTRPQKVRVYAADAFTTEVGGFDVQAAGVAPTAVATWIDLDPRTVTIPARRSPTAVRPGTRIVPFNLTIPDDALPGDHAGGLVLSLRTADAPQGTSSVVVDRRVGTRVYVQVPGARSSALEVADLRAVYTGTPNPAGKGSTRVSYTVRNVGNTILSARQSTRVETWLGEARPSAAVPDLVQLLPGAEVDVVVDLPGTWPTFRPEAVVTLVPYTGSAEQPVLLDPVTASTRFWAIPWPLLAVVLVLLVLAYGVHRWRRYRAAQPPSGAHAARPAAPTGPRQPPGATDPTPSTDPDRLVPL